MNGHSSNNGLNGGFIVGEEYKAAGPDPEPLTDAPAERTLRQLTIKQVVTAQIPADGNLSELLIDGKPLFDVELQGTVKKINSETVNTVILLSGN